MLQFLGSNKNFFARLAVNSSRLNSECEVCTCLGAGRLQCRPALCPPCPSHQHSALTPTCQCHCKQCLPGERLCPTSRCLFLPFSFLHSLISLFLFQVLSSSGYRLLLYLCQTKVVYQQISSANLKSANLVTWHFAVSNILT
jgi:hypothetical protein